MTKIKKCWFLARKFKYLKSFETFKRNFLTLWELIEIFLRRGPLVPRHFSSLRSIIYYLRSKSLFDDSFIHFSLEEGGKRPQKLEVQSKRKDVKTATEKESMRSPDNCMLVMFDGFVCFYGKNFYIDTLSNNWQESQEANWKTRRKMCLDKENEKTLSIDWKFSRTWKILQTK